MSRKTKCCKEYKRSGKYCRTCPLKRGWQIEKCDSRLTTGGFLAPESPTKFAVEFSADGGSAKKRERRKSSASSLCGAAQVTG